MSHEPNWNVLLDSMMNDAPRIAEGIPTGRLTMRLGSTVGAIHTNTIEGFWSIFKRGIVGSFHKVSAKYMPPLCC
jgi:hypothetical protein